MLSGNFEHLFELCLRLVTFLSWQKKISPLLVLRHPCSLDVLSNLSWWSFAQSTWSICWCDSLDICCMISNSDSLKVGSINVNLLFWLMSGMDTTLWITLLSIVVAQADIAYICSMSCSSRKSGKEFLVSFSRSFIFSFICNSGKRCSLGWFSLDCFLISFMVLASFISESARSSASWQIMDSLCRNCK